MRALLVPLALVLASSAAGCLTVDAPDDATADELEAIRLKLEVPIFGPSVLLGHAGPVYGFGGEPSVAVAGDGTLYVAAPMVSLQQDLLGPRGQISVWCSTDGGRTFERTNDEDGRLTQEGSNDGNGDADIVVDGSGRVHTLDLDGGVPYRWSDDRGTTWSWGGSLSDPSRPADRQWIDAHGDFLVASWAAQDGDPRSITFTRSADRGATWSAPVDIVEDVVQLGPIHIAPDGRSVLQPYVRASDSTLHLLLSRDWGSTWTDVDVGVQFYRPDTMLQRPWSPTSIFPVAAVDAGGNMYLAWSEYAQDGSTFLRMSRSPDGLNWSQPEAFVEPDRTRVFPWIVAGDEGRVAIVYLESHQRGDPNFGLHRWQVSASFLFHGEGSVAGAATSVSNGIVHVGAVCPNGGACSPRPVPLYGDRTLLDFFEAALAPGGELIVAWTQTDQLEGRNPQVRLARQAGGSTLLGLP